MQNLVDRADVHQLPQGEWLSRLVRSLDQNVIDGRVYPRFPDEAIQRQFVGSAHQHALSEAAVFHSFVSDRWAKTRRRDTGRYLDFGCGWGRITRFFLHEFSRERMAGVDIDPTMVRFCQDGGVPGQFHQIENGGRLPFADHAFQLITAYSVFTHLPRPVLEAWFSELVRVCDPDGLIVFTVEPPRFIDFIESLNPEDGDGWHRSLAAWGHAAPHLRADLQREGLAFIPSGGGDYREPAVYGETIVTPEYLSALARNHGAELVEFVDQADQFWQAVAVVRPRRRRWTDWLRL